MTYEQKISKLLVVLSPDLIRPDDPGQSSLLQRAVTLAKKTGCELELLHVCYDSELEHQLFVSEDERERQRAAIVDRDATILEEVAARLKNEGGRIRHEVRWDHPRTDAILRKIAEAKPDVVMKQSREHSYLFGLKTNTDWDLARRSPADVWLVSDDVDRIGKIVAPVGNMPGEPGDVTTARDYELLQAARAISDTFDAEVFTINAYQAPEHQRLVTGMGPAAVPAVTAEEYRQTRDRLVERHRSAVSALAQYFHLPDDNVQIIEGHPNKVIPEFVDTIDADMLVMGARSLGRMERLISAVTVEPVMSEAHVDFLIIRDDDSMRVAKAAERPVRGEPKYDLEQAIARPEEAFESPQEVANMQDVSFQFRHRILQAWESDIRAEMTGENEGGQVRQIDVNALDEIYSAKALLKMQHEKEDNRQLSLHGIC